MKSVFIFLLFISASAIGQKTEIHSEVKYYTIDTGMKKVPRIEDSDKAYLPKLKMDLGKKDVLSLGCSFITYQGDEIVNGPFWYYYGPFVETGLSLNKGHHYMCNKVGFEYYYLFFGGRMNMIHWTDFQNNSYNLRPEIGLSLFSALTVTAGYDIPLESAEKSISDGFVFSLNIAYPIRKMNFCSVGE